MAYIKTLKENELFGGQDNVEIYPVSTTQAIFSQKENGGIPEGVEYKLEDRLQENEKNTKKLLDSYTKIVEKLLELEDTPPGSCSCKSLCMKDIDGVVDGTYSTPTEEWCKGDSTDNSGQGGCGCDEIDDLELDLITK